MCNSRGHSLSAFANFSDKVLPLIRTRTCVYQWVRIVGFSKDFANVLNESP